MHIGVAKELGRSRYLHSQETRKGQTGRTSSRTVDGARWHLQERNTSDAGVVPIGEGNGVVGKEAGSLSPFIIPLKAGKPIPGEPVSREGRGRVTEPLVRNTEVHRD